MIEYILTQRRIVVFKNENIIKKEFIKDMIKQKYKIKLLNFKKINSFTRKGFYEFLLQKPLTKNFSSVEVLNEFKFLDKEALVIENFEEVLKFKKETALEILNVLASLQEQFKIFLFMNIDNPVFLITASPNSSKFIFIKVKQ